MLHVFREHQIHVRLSTEAWIQIIGITPFLAAGLRTAAAVSQHLEQFMRLAPSLSKQGP